MTTWASRRSGRVLSRRGSSSRVSPRQVTFVRSCRVAGWPVMSGHIRSHPVPSGLVSLVESPSSPVASCLVQSYRVKSRWSCQVSSRLTASRPALACPVLARWSGPVVAHPVRSCRVALVKSRHVVPNRGWSHHVALVMLVSSRRSGLVASRHVPSRRIKSGRGSSGHVGLVASRRGWSSLVRSSLVSSRPVSLAKPSPVPSCQVASRPVSSCLVKSSRAMLVGSCRVGSSHVLPRQVSSGHVGLVTSRPARSRHVASRPVVARWSGRVPSGHIRSSLVGSCLVGASLVSQGSSHQGSSGPVQSRLVALVWSGRVRPSRVLSSRVMLVSSCLIRPGLVVSRHV
jgi:hypothetical protein